MHYSQQTIPAAEWLGHGLCDCTEDCEKCFLTYCCPCVTYADNGVLLRDGDNSDYRSDCFAYILASLVCFRWLLGTIRRRQLRQKYNLEEVPCIDLCVHCFCHTCGLCQEHRELIVRTSGGSGMPEALAGGQYVGASTAEEFLPGHPSQTLATGPTV